MRLIGVAARERHIGPIHCLAQADALDHPVKALEPTIQLGRQSDLLAKQLAEAAPAEPRILCHVEHAANVWDVLELTESVSDGRMHERVRFQTRHQGVFQHPKPRRWTRRLAKTLTQCP